MVNRRNFLKSASFLTLGGLVAGKAEALQAATPVRTETTAKKSIGLQIYSLGGELTKDVPAGMKPSISKNTRSGSVSFKKRS